MAMTAPSITVVNTADETVTQWDAGVVQQNRSSSILTIQIWNNRRGETALSDLKEANITALDTNGTATSDIIVQKWVGAKVPAIDGSAADFTQIGGAYVKMLRADGLSEEDGYTISGAANDGSTVNAKNNYCTVNLRVNVPLNAKGGIYDFKMKINGYYT